MALRGAFPFVSVIVCFGLMACTPVDRSFDKTGGNGGGGSGGSGGGGGIAGMGGAAGAGGMPLGPCPTDTHRCAVPAPEGWSAPSAIVDGVPAPDCPSGYPTLVMDAHDDVAGAPATCGCQCGDGEVLCGDLVVFYRFSCGQPLGPDVASGAPDKCLAATPKQNSAVAIFDEQAGPCPPIPSVALDPPTFQTHSRACATASVDGVCENGLVCTPEVIPPFRLCVTRDGDFPCPPGYPDRAVHFKNVVDKRGCSECTCKSDVPGRCESTLYAFSDDTCTTPTSPNKLASGDVWSNSTCIPSFPYYMYTPPTIAMPSTCSGSVVDPIGAVELSEQTTFCCAMN